MAADFPTGIFPQIDVGKWIVQIYRQEKEESNWNINLLDLTYYKTVSEYKHVWHPGLCYVV